MSVHDPTSVKAASKAGEMTPQAKIEGLHEIIGEHKTAMLTTRSPEGKLASRAMVPATTDNMIFSFYINAESGKTSDVDTDPQVNVSFLTKHDDWVSISGVAKVNKDQQKIKQYWSKSLESWFDKRGGEYTGSHDDPRVALLDVIPSEIRYWKADGKLKALAEMAKAAVSSGVAAPGKLVIITEQEIRLAGQFTSQ